MSCRRSFNLNYVTLTLFTLFLKYQIELVKCKNLANYVTYTVAPEYEKYVDDTELKSRINDKQSRIETELQDQIKRAKTINESLKILQRNGAIISDNGMPDGIKFQESTIGLTEAPVFLIEPPLLLPLDEFQDDEFSEYLMTKSGLNPMHKSVEEADIDKLMNPHNITDLKEAKIAKALFKQELKRLMDEKKILLDRMEELEMEMAVDGSKSAKRKFSNCSREIHELDSNIEDYMDKIDKVNRVKRSIIKREGYDSELIDDEIEIENIEKELKDQTHTSTEASINKKEHHDNKTNRNKDKNVYSNKSNKESDNDDDDDEKDNESEEDTKKDDEIDVEDNEDED